jgi:hypothetical protein
VPARIAQHGLVQGQGGLNEKRPRDWAAEIASIESLEDRRELLKKVPAELQELVKTHLKIYWFTKQHKQE